MDLGYLFITRTKYIPSFSVVTLLNNREIGESPGFVYCINVLLSKNKVIFGHGIPLKWRINENESFW